MTAALHQPRVLRHALVLGASGLEPRDLALTSGQITPTADPQAQIEDASGLWLLPGIIDLHGDAFERVISPRPNVAFPSELALPEADRQLIANGITTVYHGLTLSWEPGLRSPEAAARFVAALSAVQPRLDCDTRINFRWETFATQELDLLLGWLNAHPGSIVSINDHTTVNLSEAPGSRKITRMIERMGLSPAAAWAALEAAAARQPEVEPAIARLCQAATSAGITLLAHDEASPEMRRTFRALGVRASEFPLTMDTAAEAASAGEGIILGAPNVLRGGSQNNAISAAEAISLGLCTALASDYWYPSQLHAALKLHHEGMPLEQAWSLIAAGPAAIAGLTDRGTLDLGKRADVIAYDPAQGRIVSVYVAGRRVYHRD